MICDLLWCCGLYCFDVWLLFVFGWVYGLVIYLCGLLIWCFCFGLFDYLVGLLCLVLFCLWLFTSMGLIGVFFVVYLFCLLFGMFCIVGLFWFCCFEFCLFVVWCVWFVICLGLYLDAGYVFGGVYCCLCLWILLFAVFCGLAVVFVCVFTWVLGFNGWLWIWFDLLDLRVCGLLFVIVSRLVCVLFIWCCLVLLWFVCFDCFVLVSCLRELALHCLF